MSFFKKKTAKSKKYNLFVIASAQEIDIEKLYIKKQLYPNAYLTKYGYLIITGVGKIKATYSLTKFLTLFGKNVLSVYNIGTSGATVYNKFADVVQCKKFIQNDYQFKKDIEINNNLKLPDIMNDYTCLTSDSFITEEHNEGKIVFDMEAYAIVEVVNNFNLLNKFYSIKVVSDIVGQNSIEHWDNDADILKEKITNLIISIK